jgi:pilus assembly protein CpaE
MPSIIIVEPDKTYGQRLAELAVKDAGDSGKVDIVASLEMALDEAERNSPDIVIVGPTLVGDLALELGTYLSSSTRTSTIFVASEVDAVLLRSAMRAGVADVIALADIDTELSSSIARALKLSGRANPGFAAQGEETGRQGRVITVFSTKGGVGKSVLSTNIAVALQKTTKSHVAILDLDLEFGDVGIMLGIKPRRTLFDAVQAFDRLDADMLEGFMETHPTGVKVMLAPLSPEDADAISAARVAHVIKLMRDIFDYVIIDTSPAALDRSDLVYIITMMDVASIKNTRISLKKLGQLGYNHGSLRLVLNRSDSKVLLQPDEVERAIGSRIDAHIPSDRCVPRSVNKGVPVVLDVPKCDVSRSIMKIVESIAAADNKEVTDVA